MIPLFLYQQIVCLADKRKMPWTEAVFFLLRSETFT